MVQPELAGYEMSVTLWTLVFLGAGSVLVLGLLYFVRPEIRQRTIVAMVPWMVAGGAMRALDTIGAYPDQFALLFDQEAVALTTWILTGMVWAMMVTATSFERSTGTDAQYLTAAGVGVTMPLLVALLFRSFGAELQAVLIAVGALVAAVVLAAVAYVLLSYVYSKAIIETGLLGWILVFGHVLDGTTTAVAVDVRHIPVNYAVGRMITDYAATLPTEQYLGTAWLLVLIRLVLAIVVVSGVAHLLSRYLKDREGLGYLLLGVVTAFGVGPGIHHLLILLITS